MPVGAAPTGRPDGSLPDGVDGTGTLPAATPDTRMRGSALVTAFPPAARARRAALIGVVCAGLTAVLTACGEEPVDPDKGTNGVGRLSAPAIEAKARNAAREAESVRLSGTVVSKGRSYKLDMRLKEDGGTGSVTSKGSTFELLRIDDELFMKAGADFWDNGGQPSGSDEAAGKLEDKYVKVPDDDPVYDQLRGFTDKDVLLDGLLGLHGKLGKGERPKVGGVRTIEVTGGKGTGGTLAVSLLGTPYPLKLERAGGAGVVRLADWDKEFALEAPGKGETVDYGGQLPKSSDAS
ncbi:lipoprotein [Streptomyces chryseus]|uniref:Lipoprotein n=1 Tax=Streptomyces chryseus TaxID=68186 RepID=A0ABQ3DTK2_9ACTN|nr:lipoprotein [Streptomyces chryseus]GHB12203.1 lipoprotein [Streptomyces chryseus]